MIRIFTCEEWGARPPMLDGKPVSLDNWPWGEAEGIVLHHTASANRRAWPDDLQYERDAAFVYARRCQSDHQNRKPRPWVDSGQHFTVSRGGLILEGRHGSLEMAKQGRVIAGAHSDNALINRTWFGIETEGHYSRVQPTLATWNALVELCAWLSIWGNTQAANIEPHSKFKATECCGEQLRQALPKLRVEVRRRKLELLEVLGK